MADKPNFQGKYKLVKNEFFEEFLAANGANWMVRKMAINSTPTLHITQDGDKFSTKLESMVHTKVNEFTIGQEFEETQQTGDVMKVLPAWEGNKLVMTYDSKVPGKGKPQKLIRELEGDDLLTVTMVLDDITAKRIFQRIP